MRRSTSQNRIPHPEVASQPRDERPALQRHCSTAKRTIDENPLVATLTMFGVGLAVGSVVGRLLADVTLSRERTLSDRVRRRVNSVLSDIVPDSLEQRFHA